MGYSFLTTQKQNEEIANAQRIALGIEYFGRDFCGWQHQVQACGIQDALEAALARVAGKPVATIAAGRTDAGVHATGQVVHFDTDVHRPVTAWVRGVNSHLPEGVAVLWAQPVTTEFHARFSALSRSYQYVLLNHMVRPGLHSGRVGWYHAPLNDERMQQAAANMISVPSVQQSVRRIPLCANYILCASVAGAILFCLSSLQMLFCTTWCVM
jgi:tRNA pseudouridine(38-40) synthase